VIDEGKIDILILLFLVLAIFIDDVLSFKREEGLDFLLLL
jgi:hypothetical protein